MISLPTVNLVEVFSSIQGEGLFVGCRQVFVRLAGCNISCSYCDTQESFLAPSQARIETQPGERIFRHASNPMPVEDVVDAVALLCRSSHHSISITGGEPLLQPTAIRALSNLRSTQAKIFLETNGTLPEVLKEVIDAVDIISMDIKLPEVLAGQNYWFDHADFLRVAATKEVYVKIVIAGNSLLPEFLCAVDLIASVNQEIPLILQPVTPVLNTPTPSPNMLLQWQGLALDKLSTVRVIPQTHKLLGVL